MSSSTISDDGNTQFHLRWRGRQEGPYPAFIIEEKLATNQIGLLHEISHNGQWMTLRDFIAGREALLRAQREAQEEDQRQRLEAERQTREKAERRHAELLAGELRKNNLLEAGGKERQRSPAQALQVALKPHRAGSILALGIIGLLICGPLCIAAWVMGDSDIREMDAGAMDPSGRSTTATGRSCGRIGTVLWIIGFVFFIIFQ